MEASPWVLPIKLYYSIAEVAQTLELPQHVVRYWEKEFPQIRPVRRAGNRRYFRRQDVEILLEVKRLLHEEGYTVAGAKARLGLGRKPDPSTLLDDIHRELLDLHRRLTSS